MKDTELDFFDEQEYSDYGRTLLAAQRRERGAAAAIGANNWLAKAKRTSELSGKPIEVVYEELLTQNPQMIERLRTYVADRGYTPHGDLHALCMQVSQARGEHVNEVLDRYDPECFDEIDNFFLDSKARKAARKARKQEKFTRRAERRSAKHRNKMAKLDADFNQTQRNEEVAEREAIEPPAPMPVYKTIPRDTMHEQDNSTLANPSLEVATAEIVGEEMEQDSYEGESENFLPFLAAALDLGAKAAQNPERVGNTVTDIKSLFKKKPVQKNAKGKPATAAEVLNAGVKKVVENVEQQKKKDFMRKNGIWIVLAVLAFIFLGYSFSKK